MAWEDFAKRMRAVNARITVVQRLYGKNSNIFKSYVSIVKRAGGNTRFSKKMLADGSLRNIAKVDRALTAIENSAYSSKEGRKRIGEKARNTFGLNHSSFSDTTLQKMFYVFDNSSFSKISEVFQGNSELFVDAIMDAFESDKAKKKDISKAVDYFTEHLDLFDKEPTIAIEQFRQLL